MITRATNSILVLAVALAATSCHSQPKPMDLEKATKVVEFAEEIFTKLKGTPKKHTVEKVQNAHVEGQIDEWHTIEYPGIKLKYYRVVPEKRNMLSTLELTSSNYVLPFGIKLGNSRESIVSILGKPSTSGPDAIEYECGDPYSQTVSFEFKNGCLSAVEWNNEID